MYNFSVNTISGNEFARISYVNSQSTIYKLPALSVELGIGSELLAMPNQFVKLYFEISNNRDQTVFLRFRCTDEKSLLVSMIPVRYVAQFINHRFV